MRGSPFAIHILTWRLAEMLFEHSCEMLWILEPELLGGGGDAHSADKQLLGLAHDKPSDDVTGCIVCHLADQVAEVVGGEEKLLSTIFHGGQPVSQL